MDGFIKTDAEKSCGQLARGGTGKIDEVGMTGAVLILPNSIPKVRRQS